MSTSPKFRITIEGIAAGARAERVRLAVAKKFTLTPSQVEQLLANQAGPLTGLMQHQDAWTLRNELLDLGVECRIAPVPRSNLVGLPGKVSLQGTDPDRHVGHAPRVQRASRQSVPMRSGKAVAKVQPRSANPLFAISPRWRVAAVVVLVLVVGFSLQSVRERHGETVAVANSAR